MKGGINDEYRPRVFLSCGQHTRDERLAAQSLGDILRKKGYSVFIATEQTSFEGVKEGIFPQLRDAEYFLFVDFPRDNISGMGHRGSLFSHQELAIAAFLDRPYIGFRHRDVRLEGVSSFMLSNSRPFDSVLELPGLLRSELRRRQDWRTGWQNRLVLSRVVEEHDDMVTGVVHNGNVVHVPYRYFHIKVSNLHWEKTAFGCTAFVESIEDAESGDDIEFRPSEVKWAGTGLPSVVIPPGRERSLDACRMAFDVPSTVEFLSFSDSGHHMSPLSRRCLKVTYAVVSENFSPARLTLLIAPGGEISDAKVESV